MYLDQTQIDMYHGGFMDNLKQERFYRDLKSVALERGIHVQNQPHTEDSLERNIDTLLRLLGD